MIIRKSLLALALAASCALAALPSTILFQGNMVLDGKPVSGSKEMVVSLYDALTAGTEVWTKTYTAMFNNGYYAVALDNLESVDFSKPLFVGLKIGAETVATRIPLTSAPYAKRAAVADSAVTAAVLSAAASAQFAKRNADSLFSAQEIFNVDNVNLTSKSSIATSTGYAKSGVLVNGRDGVTMIYGSNGNTGSNLTVQLGEVSVNTNFKAPSVQLNIVSSLPVCNAANLGKVVLYTAVGTYNLKACVCPTVSAGYSWATLN